MKIFLMLLIVIASLSCVQNSENSNSKDLTINEMKENVNSCFPDELESYIGGNTIFLFSIIAKDTVDYLGNKVYKVDSDFNFTRIENKETPSNGLIFSSEQEETIVKLDSGKYKEFEAYLSELTNKLKDGVYKTPGNLDISGGINKYVYLNAEGKQIHACFEPESDSLVHEIEFQFDKLF
ncbi:hypothetical protein [Marinigracilibium pacificum]|uniref:Uncharacterized protein n=1 Tax=Marinigracilibium pacificum TaxID=2729599 RepID=A0A848IYE2_9BACT|nr:hypothetical protein [Marinigracilibium pacificum]NMM47264.1 hypothetical protein [Marinigracilibium pacificum]